MTQALTRPQRDVALAGSPPHRWAKVVAAIAALLLALGIGVVVGRSGRSSGSGRPGAVDVGFAQDMSVHHQQALLMANLAISRGGPAVRQVADSILVDQAQELGQLLGWLKMWGAPAADPHPMSWMSMGPGPMATSDGQEDAMPGMASPTQLEALEGDQGRAFDVLFLQLMVRHHEGGIEMAHDAAVDAGSGAVRSAAQAMVVEQVQDLSVMRPLLVADGGTPLPAP